MVSKLFIKITIVIVLAIPIITYGGKTPLSEFSSQYDDDYFKAANNTVFDYYLSKNEKDFLQILNMARMSPRLFAISVIIPYCQKNGYTSSAYSVIQRLCEANTLSIISSHIYFKKLASDFSKKNEILNYNGISSLDDFIKNTNIKSNITYSFSNSDKAIDIILQLLIENGYNGDFFRNILLGSYTDAGIIIKKHPYKGYNTIITADNLNEEQKNKLPTYPNINIETFEEYHFIDHINFPKDTILNSFIKSYKPQKTKDVNTGVINSTSIEIDAKTFNKIKDSLISNHFEFTTKEMEKTIYYFSNNEFENHNFNFTTSLENGGFDPEKSINYYCLERTIDDDNKTKIQIRSLINNFQQFHPFSKDSIGIYNDTIELRQVDKLITYLNLKDTFDLSKKLTSYFITDLEKVRAIFYWMHTNIQYDYQGLSIKRPTYEVSDVLQKRVAICDGYARLFNYLCSKSNIRSVYLSGLTPFGDHAWNAVFINKKWFLIDVTWGESFFLMNPDQFSETHYPTMKKWTLLQNPLSLKEWEKKYINSQ